MCSNGVAGIQTGDACCELECGQCGGLGCEVYGGGVDAGLGEDSCCQTEIEEEGELCSVTLEAPCVVDDGKRTSLGTFFFSVQKFAKCLIHS